jgi:hypothetical protein
MAQGINKQIVALTDTEFRSAASARARYACGNIHVGKSYLVVCRILRKRLRRGLWRALPHSKRRILIEETIKAHEANRQLYSSVMSGRF